MNLFNKQELFLLEQIVKKNFSSKYKDSVLGIFWTVLRPLMMMIILTIVFSSVFGRSVENYPVYLLCGRAIFNCFTGTTDGALRILKGNKNIFLRTSAPKHIFVIANVISNLINFAIVVAILLLVMLATNATFYLTIMPLAIIPVFSLIIMELGISLILAIVCVYYTDIVHLWGVFTLLLLYASAIFYPMDIIPLKYQQIFRLNPVFWIIDQFRDLMMYGRIPDLLYIVNSYLLSFIILIIGIIIFKKYADKVATKF